MEAHSTGELAMLAQRPVRILVVDDNMQEQQILKLKLEALGATVIQVRHGRMALMTAQKAVPDIILLELATSDMPGLEVLRHLKAVKRTSSIPVICISDSPDDSYRMRALRLNADWYLSKPFRFSEMLARLRYHAQQIASSKPSTNDMSYEELRRSIMRASVDTVSDIQDVRKALHGLKGYVGTDDYYLNTKLEICFRNLMRIESRLKDFRVGSSSKRSGARMDSFPIKATAKDGLAIGDFPRATELPDSDDDDGTHGGGAGFS